MMKTIEQLKASIGEVLESNGVNLSLYFGLGDSAQRIYKRADLNDHASTSVCQSFANGVNAFFANEDLEVKELSELDNRSNVLWFYDFDEAPAEFQSILQLGQQGQAPAMFSFAEDDMANIKSLVIKIASVNRSILFFKQFFPVSLIKRDQILLYKSQQRFSVLDENIIKIPPGFDAVVVDDDFYINDFKKFESAFKFEDIAQKKMNSVVAAIAALNIVDDVKHYLAAHMASKRDIIRAGRSDVLQLDSAVIIAFAAARQAQLGLNIVDGKIVLSSKGSVKTLYKLLNDDFLKSELTAADYEAIAKNKMQAPT